MADEAGELAAQAVELQQRLLRLSERLEEEQDRRLPEPLGTLGYEIIRWHNAGVYMPDNGQPVLAQVANLHEGLVNYVLWPAVWRDGVGWHIQLPECARELEPNQYVAYWCAMPRVPGIEEGQP